jgi:hypothetical protein
LHGRNLAIVRACLGGKFFEFLERLIAHGQIAVVDPINRRRPARALALARFKARLQSGDNLRKPVSAKRAAAGIGTSATILAPRISAIFLMFFAMA